MTSAVEVSTQAVSPELITRFSFDLSLQPNGKLSAGQRKRRDSNGGNQ
jgi:hypothetical protein